MPEKFRVYYISFIGDWCFKLNEISIQFFLVTWWFQKQHWSVRVLRRLAESLVLYLGPAM